MIKYVKTLIEEKGLDLEHTFEVEGDSGMNFIPLSVVVEHIAIAPKHEQSKIRNILTQIDFKNGDVMHFFNHLAGAIAR